MQNAVNERAAAEVSEANPHQSRHIDLVVLDMAGTTVADDGVVLKAFDEAATAVGVAATGPEREKARQYVLDTMGQSKIEVFRALFDDEGRAQQANVAFEAAYRQGAAGAIRPIPGAEQAISELRSSGVKVALSTGFSGTTQDMLLDALGWQNVADVVLAPGADVRGRPYPDLVLAALLRTGVDDVAKVAVVGDTSSDILSGRRAGASIVVGVLTGAHDEAALRAAGATHLLPSVAELPPIILSH